MKKHLIITTIIIVFIINILGCTMKQTKKSSTIQNGKPEDAKADTFYVEEVISNYEELLINAINENDFSKIENLLVPNSNLYISQKKLVPDLYKKNIKEKLINFEIAKIEDLSKNGVYKVYVIEKIAIKYPDKQDYETKEFNWIYDVIYYNNNSKVGISNIEKWNK